MATIKAYTDLEQSKKLAKILPLESADYQYEVKDNLGSDNTIITAAWSLATLLDVLPFPVLSKDKLGNDKVGWMVSVYPNNSRIDSRWYDNPIDPCYDTVILLHKEKLL